MAPDEDNIQRGYFAIIPASVRYDKNITPNAKLLYGEITALCNDRGYCWASNAYFSDLYGVSKTSISKWVSSLQEAGYVNVSLIYKDGSMEIESRRISIVNEGIKEKLNTPITDVKYPIKEKFNDNSTVNNTKNKPAEAGAQKSLNLNLADKKQSKAKDMGTMRGMINTFTENDTIREALNDYFSIRSKKGLKPTQWKIILDDLRTFAGDDANVALDKIKGATAGGYMQIIASWEKEKKATQNKPKFDNTAGHKVAKAVINMTKDEIVQEIATDEDGNPLQF